MVTRERSPVPSITDCMCVGLPRRCLGHRETHGRKLERLQQQQKLIWAMWPIHSSKEKMEQVTRPDQEWLIIQYSQYGTRVHRVGIKFCLFCSGEKMLYDVWVWILVRVTWDTLSCYCQPQSVRQLTMSTHVSPSAGNMPHWEHSSLLQIKWARPKTTKFCD